MHMHTFMKPVQRLLQWCISYKCGRRPRNQKPSLTAGYCDWSTMMLQTNPLFFSVSFGTVKQRTGLKLVPRDQHNHLNVKKECVSITHMAVIKSLSPCSVSTGCLLHLSLIWLRALIWANRSLTGIQSSLCTRAAAAVETQRLPCVRNLGGNAHQQSGPVNKHLF